MVNTSDVSGKVVDPDPHGSGAKRAKNTHKNQIEKSKAFLCFEVLKFSLEG
jgi:hypothetical protein